METTLTTSDVILGLQIATIIGFLFLFAFTLTSYRKMKSRLILYISIAFLVIALSVLLRITVVPWAEAAGFEEHYVEATIEGVQFFAAFLFFYGLKILKVGKKEGQAE